jgi:hypothetical protein
VIDDDDSTGRERECFRLDVGGMVAAAARGGCPCAQERAAPRVPPHITPLLAYAAQARRGSTELSVARRLLLTQEVDHESEQQE